MKAPVMAALGSPCRIVGVCSEEWSHRLASWATVTGFRYLTINLDDKDQILGIFDQTQSKEQLPQYPTPFRLNAFLRT
jgi:hypothetical protein